MGLASLALKQNNFGKPKFYTLPNSIQHIRANLNLFTINVYIYLEYNYKQSFTLKGWANISKFRSIQLSVSSLAWAKFEPFFALKFQTFTDKMPND